MSKGPHIGIRVEENGFLPGRRYFVLEDGEVSQVPVVCEADFLAWERLVCGRFRVDHTVVSENPEVIVGSAFLGHDDKPPDSRPMPWRTTIWGGPHNGRMWSYATFGEAKEGHWKAVDLARLALKQQPPAGRSYPPLSAWQARATLKLLREGPYHLDWRKMPMTAIMLQDLGREVSVEELRRRVSEIDIRAGLRYVTVVSSSMLRGNLGEWLDGANSFNLPLLAKAFVLWGRMEGGRPLNLTNSQDNEGLWLLKAANSLPWHSRLAAEFDTDDSVLRMIIRQGFMRYYTDDPLDARIARTWMMLHDLVGEGDLNVPDPSGELCSLLGVSAEDLWVVGLMIWTYHMSTTSTDGTKWVFDPDAFVLEGPRQDDMRALLHRVLQNISLTADQFRQRYAAEDSKYQNRTDRAGFWVSEFNILRDFPVVSLGDGKFVAPFPTFALTRALDGFYYDLLDEYARRKVASGAGGNAYDNDMSNTLGTLFERYVGRQLGLLTAPGNQLRGEFEYGTKKDRRLSTDWILLRPGRPPVLFECKAREAVLDVQRYANLEELRNEVRKAIGKACKQLVNVIKAIDARKQGLEQYYDQDQFICAVVLQAPLPFHMVRDIRSIIEEVAADMQPEWNAGRLHAKSFAEQDFREVGIIPACIESLVLDPNFRG